jgi:hypothetical protein
VASNEASAVLPEGRCGGRVDAREQQRFASVKYRLGSGKRTGEKNAAAEAPRLRPAAYLKERNGRAGSAED